MRVVFIVVSLVSFVRFSAFAEPLSPDILFILIDSLRAGHVGCYGYSRDTTPFLDRFAREECVRFETVIPGGSWTQPAVMTLFTALPADGHGRVLPKRPHNDKTVTLAQALRAAGYQTIGITANAMTHRRFGYARGFDLWDDFSATLPPDAGIDRIASGAARGGMLTRMGLSKLRRRDPTRPLFLFLFYMDPHWDFYPPSPYDRKFSECGPKRGAWRTPAEKVSPELRQRTIDAYDGEIAYCDSVLSNLVESVRKTPRWNETIIVIAGDHGESFWERGYSGHGNDLYDLELKVPLLIRIPPSRAVRVSEGWVVRGQVGGLDVAPTLLDFAGVPIPPSWAGRSLRSDMENGRSDGRPVVSETRIRGGLWQRAVRTDRWKVIAVDDFSRPCAVYHLTTDPHEKTNLVQRGVSFPVEVTDLFPLLQPKEGR